ncbi:MAG: anthranilate phosphoribosyltransferase [Ignavibacteriales bacterium]
MNLINHKKLKEPYESLYKLNIGQSLDEFEAEEAMLEILNEKNLEKRVSLLTMLLNGVMIKGPSVSEIKGLLNASLSLDNIFKKEKPKIKLPKNELLVGVASSGKKGFKTINITTPASFVAAACGAYTAKACSHSTSSKTGSSDFLEIVGININIPLNEKIKILQEKKISFFSIEDTTPNFADVYGGVFYAPHAMSFALAGLSFPVKIDSLAYGLSHPNVKLSLEVYKEYGFKNVLVYTSTEDGVHYLDELPIAGHVNLVGMKNGKVGRQISANIKEGFTLNPSYNLNEIAEKEDRIENVKASLKVLQGTGLESHTDAICINAALIILLAKKVNSLNEGYLLAKENIKNGNVFKLFLDVVEMYGGSKEKIYNLIDENCKIKSN